MKSLLISNYGVIRNNHLCIKEINMLAHLAKMPLWKGYPWKSVWSRVVRALNTTFLQIYYSWKKMLIITLRSLSTFLINLWNTFREGENQDPLPLGWIEKSQGLASIWSNLLSIAHFQWTLKHPEATGFYRAILCNPMQIEANPSNPLLISSPQLPLNILSKMGGEKKKWKPIL